MSAHCPESRQSESRSKNVEGDVRANGAQRGNSAGRTLPIRWRNSRRKTSRAKSPAPQPRSASAQSARSSRCAHADQERAGSGDAREDNGPAGVAAARDGRAAGCHVRGADAGCIAIKQRLPARHGEQSPAGTLGRRIEGVTAATTTGIPEWAVSSRGTARPARFRRPRARRCPARNTESQPPLI